MRIRAWVANAVCCASIISSSVGLIASAAPYFETLSSENIATNAMQVAESTNTTGRCYAAVCRALKPLSVSLHGASAYEARDLLLQDQRFVSVYIASKDQLQRGDIIVFDKSPSHPDGHISVYQGNYTEASDHVAPVTKTQSYGGASVFRLRGIYLADGSMIPVAPPYSRQGNASVGAPSQFPNYVQEGLLGSTTSNVNDRHQQGISPVKTSSPVPSSTDQTSSTLREMRTALRSAGRIAQKRIGTSLAQRLTRFLLDP